MLKYFKLLHIFFAGFFSSAVLAQSAILDSLIHQALEVSPEFGDPEIETPSFGKPG